MKRKQYHPSLGANLVTKAIWDANNKRMHERPDYSQADAEVTAAWLNGRDMPLATMVVRPADPWDPARPRSYDGWPIVELPLRQ